MSRKSRGALPPKSTPEKELKSCLFLHCVEAGGRARNGGSCTPHLITQGVKLPVAALALALSRDVGASHCSYNFPSRGILRFRGNNVAKMPSPALRCFVSQPAACRNALAPLPAFLRFAPLSSRPWPAGHMSNWR